MICTLQVGADWAEKLNVASWPKLVPLLSPGWEERATSSPPNQTRSHPPDQEVALRLSYLEMEAELKALRTMSRQLPSGFMEALPTLPCGWFRALTLQGVPERSSMVDDWTQVNLCINVC